MRLKHPKKAVLLGLVLWLIPFVVSVFIFPLKKDPRTVPLFESLMPVVITMCTVALCIRYFRHVKKDFYDEGVRLGLVWLAVSVMIDLFLFMPDSPMQMSPASYMMDIGITYLIIPSVTIGFGYILERRR